MAVFLTLAFISTARAADQPVSVPSVPVQTDVAKTEDFPIYLTGLGTVEAYNTITVKTQIDGQLQSLAFTEGQDVKKGDLLAVIDPRPYQAAADQAAAKIEQDQASLANARYLLTKDQILAKQSIATAEAVEAQQSQVDGFIALLEEDKAAKEAADVNLSYTQIRSPIDGKTGIRFVDAGNQVHTTDANGLVVVTQTRPISVISTLREGDLDAVREALKTGVTEVTALTSDQSRKLGVGTLTLIDNEINQSNGSIRLKSTFANDDEALWPGEFVTLQVLVKTIKDAVTVPSTALQRGPDGYFVYTVSPSDTVSVAKIAVGPIGNGRAVVTSGLANGQAVVTQGQYRLDAGTRVSVTTPTSSSAPQEQ